MGIASSALEGFQQALAERVTYSADRVTAPLENVFKFHYVGPESKKVSVPVFANDLTMSVASGALASTTDSFSNAISETDITLLPYNMITTISRMDLIGNNLWMQAISDSAAKAYHNTLMGLIGAKVAALTAVGASGSTFTATGHINPAIGSIQASGFAGPFGAVINPVSMQQLRADGDRSNWGDKLQTELYDFGNVERAYGANLYFSSSVGTSAGNYLNYIGSPECIQVGVRQEPTIEVTSVGNGVDVKVAVACHVGVATVAANAGRWLKAGTA